MRKENQRGKLPPRMGETIGVYGERRVRKLPPRMGETAIYWVFHTLHIQYVGLDKIAYKYLTGFARCRERFQPHNRAR